MVCRGLYERNSQVRCNVLTLKSIYFDIWSWIIDKLSYLQEPLDFLTNNGHLENSFNSHWKRRSWQERWWFNISKTLFSYVLLVAEKSMAEWMNTIKDAIIGYYCTFSKPVHHTNSGKGLTCPVEFVRYLDIFSRFQLLCQFTETAAPQTVQHVWYCNQSRGRCNSYSRICTEGGNTFGQCI